MRKNRFNFLIASSALRVGFKNDCSAITLEHDNSCFYDDPQEAMDIESFNFNGMIMLSYFSPMMLCWLS